MADAKHPLEFLEGGIGMLFDVGLELVRVEFAPVSPAFFGSQHSLLGSSQITIDGAPPKAKAPGGLDFGPAFVDKFHHPFAQIKAIGFHAHKPVRLCANINVKFYIGPPGREREPAGNLPERINANCY